MNDVITEADFVKLFLTEDILNMINHDNDVCSTLLAWGKSLENKTVEQLCACGYVLEHFPSVMNLSHNDTNTSVISVCKIIIENIVMNKLAKK